jgi:hypothetical protein
MGKQAICDLSKSSTNKVLGPDDIALLAAVVARNPSITELKLSENNVAGTTYEGGRWTSSNLAGVTALGEMLKLNRSLTHLDLGDNRMGPSGVRIICAALSCNSTAVTQEEATSESAVPVLRGLILRGNMIWGEGVSAILAMLKQQTLSRQIGLTAKAEVSSDLGDGATHLSSAAQVGLVELDLSDNNKIQDEQRQLLKEWCLAAGVALELDSVKLVSSRKASVGRKVSFASSRLPGVPGTGRKIAFKGPSVQRSVSFRNKQLVKAAKQQQRQMKQHAPLDS